MPIVYKMIGTGGRSKTVAQNNTLFEFDRLSPYFQTELFLSIVGSQNVKKTDTNIRKKTGEENENLFFRVFLVIHILCLVARTLCT